VLSTFISIQVQVYIRATSKPPAATVSSPVLRLQIRTDPHLLAGLGIFGGADPDSWFENWHLINLKSVEKYCKLI
jgi:hypothetical protein